MINKKCKNCGKLIIVMSWKYCDRKYCKKLLTKKHNEKYKNKARIKRTDTLK